MPNLALYFIVLLTGLVLVSLATVVLGFLRFKNCYVLLHVCCILDMFVLPALITILVVNGHFHGLGMKTIYGCYIALIFFIAPIGGYIICNALYRAGIDPESNEDRIKLNIK